MGTTADKLNKLLKTKADIRNAIISKGVEVADDTVFAAYPDAIRKIETGSSEGGSDAFFNLRTSDGADFTYLFYSYDSKTLDLSSWDTSNVKYMDGMFANCYNLGILDIRNFNMNKISKLPTYMFDNCAKLYELRLDNCDNYTISMIIRSSKFPTDELKDATRKIYVNPDNIEGLTAPTNWIFVDSDGNEIVPDEGGEEIPELTVYVAGEYQNNNDITEVYTLVTKEHNDLHDMFLYCNSLTTINGIDQWDTSNVTEMRQMFTFCISLKTLNLSSFNTSNVRDMESMFKDCENLETLDISNFEINDINVMNMFEGCEKLHELRLDNCDYDTINRIITSEGFPTGNVNIDGIYYTRKMYVQEANIINPNNQDERLTVPDGWEFVPIN